MKTGIYSFFAALCFSLIFKPFIFAAERKYETEALNLLTELVPYRTVAGNGQVIPMANVIVKRFEDAGFPDEDIHLIPMYEDTAGLVVRLKGSDSSEKPVVFMGHMDIVDAKPSEWELDPFVVSEVNGKLIGRGVADNKDAISLFVTTMIRLKKEGVVPKRDLVLVLSGDEETGAKTTKELYTTYRHLTDAEFAFNSDAGGGNYDENGKAVSFGIEVAEKASMNLKLTATNSGGHSSAPRDDNAIYELADALVKLGKYKFPVRYNEMTLDYFRENAKQSSGEMAAAMRAFANNPTDERAANGIEQFPEIKGFIRTTCVATMLSGGNAPSALARKAEATVNCRIYPGVSVEDVKSQIRDVIGNPAIEISDLNIPEYTPGASDMIPAAYDVIKKAVQAQHPHVEPLPYMAAYTTDAKVTRSLGIPTYGVYGVYYGVGDGNSHGLNENITKQYFYDALDYWYIVMSEL
ncbi:M20/M25/M40 family metallo-hydrolase [Pseudemcibacter aquimaris]|uniref:M20/M25/M40 family metallo-hydrolase n=1 Tax=Pseudemcibacter aquimaris TaxID=2857064 RepID=UPI00201201D9|nr:M20/M25/M40 family metallo-hydrolase [Pseudemcibacter aquimaris]MCC3861200.1 M20/M25/M40 family metallo-hydrolase [Pseudemcibacter aquimaris]WDU57975.1 M20/M25/M40 family metallo-hydrolase [Pseudemcibacter aquimaris]